MEDGEGSKWQQQSWQRTLVDVEESHAKLNTVEMHQFVVLWWYCT